MHECGRAAIAVRSSQSSYLADREPEKAGGLGHEELAAFHGIQDHQALLGTLRQKNRLPILAPWDSPGSGEDIFTEILGRP